MYIFTRTFDPSSVRAFRARSDQKNIVSDGFSVQARTVKHGTVPDRTYLNRHPCARSCMFVVYYWKVFNFYCFITRVRCQYLLAFNTTTLTNFTMDNEKLIELVRTHTELRDLSHSKYSDSTWKEKIQFFFAKFNHHEE